MPILQEQFGGIAPKISPKKLPPQLAQVAENCRWQGGKLQPVAGIADVSDVAGLPLSLYYDQITNVYRSDLTKRSYVRPFLAGDLYQFTYYTDGIKPRIYAFGDPTYDLGIPRPTMGSITVSTHDVSDPLTLVEVSYAVAWVDGYGRLGPLSDASGIVSVNPDDPAWGVTIPRPTTPPTSWNVGSWRVYRTSTGSSSTEFQFVGDATFATGVFVDNQSPDALFEVAESDIWEPLPDTAEGLILHVSSLFAFTKNEVYASESFIPHGFPYSWGFQEKVMGLVALSGGVLVLTDGRPYLLAGSEAANMQILPLESSDVCLSKDSIVDFGSTAIYASTNGLIGVSGTNVINLTNDLFDKESWPQFNPTSILAFQYENLYIGVHSGGAFSFDPQTKDFSTLDLDKIIAWAYNPEADQVAVLYDLGVDRRLGLFNEGSLLTYTWRSRVEVQPDFKGYAVVRVEADGYPLTLTVIGDAESDTITIQDREPHRLPVPYVAKNWSFQIEGTHAVDLIGIFESMGVVV